MKYKSCLVAVFVYEQIVAMYALLAFVLCDALTGPQARAVVVAVVCAVAVFFVALHLVVVLMVLDHEGSRYAYRTM